LTSFPDVDIRTCDLPLLKIVWRMFNDEPLHPHNQVVVISAAEMEKTFDF
jgi:hypothetical protein